MNGGRRKKESGEDGGGNRVGEGVTSGFWSLVRDWEWVATKELKGFVWK